MSRDSEHIEKWLDAIRRIRTSPQRQGRRAPYKPLVLLWAIGRIVRRDTMPVAYEDAEAPLAQLLREYAISETTPKVADPFVRLRSDPPGSGSKPSVWILRDAHGNALRGNNDQVVQALPADATGDLDDELKALLDDDKALRRVVAALLGHIPEETSHPAILTQTGLHELNGPMQSSRDPLVVKQVRAAYRSRCAFCSFDAKMFGNPKALHVAHIQPVSSDGPDEVTNCLLLCSLHHDLFDIGALAVDSYLTVQVSDKLASDDMHARMISVALNGRRVDLPPSDEEKPSPRQLRWHRENVFKGEPLPR